jgi:ubiquinone/menaquinone biosynthesis C-methylase UbiE
MNVRFHCMKEVPQIGDHDLEFLTRLIRHPIAGLVYRRRFRMVMALCPEAPRKVLEIGYGAGFLAYCLAPACGEYVGIDVHASPHIVQESLNRQGVRNIELRQEDARKLEGIQSESMDLVVSVSCLEHIREQDDVQKQVLRVLKPGGLAVYGMPVKNIVSRLLFRMVGYDDSVIHPTTTLHVLAAAKRQGLVRERQTFLPPLLGHRCSLYWAGSFRKTAKQA